MRPNSPSTRRTGRFGVISMTIGLACLCSMLSLSWSYSSTALASLPDHRVYELVSTSGTWGEPYAPPAHLKTQITGVLNSEHPFQAAENGEAITYVAEPAVTGGSGETGNGEGNQWLATRTAKGWTATVITPQNKGEFQPFEAFGPNLEVQYFEGGRQPLVAGVPAGCSDLYARESATGTYRALFLPTAGVECGRPLLAGTANDGADVLFQSEAALISPAVEATEVPPGRSGHNEYGDQFGRGCTYGCNLYEETPSGLRLISVIAGTPVPNAMFGGYSGSGSTGTANFSNVISTNGSRIFWTDTETGPQFEHVYVLEDGSNTVQVSGAGAAEYWTATPDGRYVYYTEAGGLWRFDTEDNTREAIAPEGSGAQAAIGTNQTGADGAYVYFVAAGALAAGATPKVCSSYRAQREKITAEFEEGLITFAEAKAEREHLNGEIEEEQNGGAPPNTGCNLYLRHGGTTTLIAVLAPEDNESEVGSEDDVGDVGGDWRAGLGLRTAEITPDGEHLVFESSRALTGYLNRPEGTNQLQFEVFMYGVGAEAPVCVSCDPSGDPPNVTELESGTSRLPASTSSATYTRRWISNDGSRVFFDSEQRLVSQDTNSVQDVYEWEREGTSGCPVATSTEGGCVFLLSGGESQGYSFLVDADATGQNVFFEHQGSLGGNEVAPDRNQLYDARVGGGFSEASAGCVAAGCQAETQSPPAFATPISNGLSDIGNFSPPAPKELTAPQTRAKHLSKALKACRSKHNKKRHVACERLARRRYGPVHHASRSSKAKNNRKAQK